MMKTLGIMGAACTLMATTAASADVSGIEIDSLGNMGNGETYRMYALVGAGERVDAVFGNSAGSMTIGTADGMSFYQNSYGGPTSTSCNSDFFLLAPELEWDSYVTIGAIYANGSPFANNALLDIGIDWTDFNAGGDLAGIDNGSWFVTPADAQGGEVGGRVLIGQFTVVGGTGNGYADLVGQVSIQGKNADGSTYQSMSVGWIPAPGALALLGLAGLAGRRRRR
jgi:hypothetical protein